MDRLERIKDNILNLTDQYADNGDYIEDIEYLLNEVERLKKELKVFINHKCEKMTDEANVKSYYDHENKATIYYCHYCGEELKKVPATD